MLTIIDPLDRDIMYDEAVISTKVNDFKTNTLNKRPFISGKLMQAPL